jgi:hypothetical protein
MFYLQFLIDFCFNFLIALQVISKSFLNESQLLQIASVRACMGQGRAAQDEYVGQMIHVQITNSRVPFTPSLTHPSGDRGHTDSI